MTTPTSRPFSGADDLDAYVDLLRHVIEADGDGLDFSIDDITAEWIDDEPGWIRTLRVWDDKSRLAASFGVWHEIADDQNRAYAALEVHPAARAVAFVDEVVGSLLTGTAELVDRPVDLRIGCGALQTWKRDGFQRHGFTVDRFFHRMSLELQSPPNLMDMPPGFEIRPLAGASEVNAWVSTFNLGFAGHYDAPTRSVEEKRLQMSRPQYRPDTDLVIVSETEGIVGVALCEIERVEDGELQAWVRYIAIRPEFRGRGLGRPLLTAGIRALFDAGHTQIWLGADSQNESGALALYESAGFRIAHHRVVYLKRVSPA